MSQCNEYGKYSCCIAKNVYVRTVDFIVKKKYHEPHEKHRLSILT